MRCAEIHAEPSRKRKARGTLASASSRAFVFYRNVVVPVGCVCGCGRSWCYLGRYFAAPNGDGTAAAASRLRLGCDMVSAAKPLFPPTRTISSSRGVRFCGIVLVDLAEHRRNARLIFRRFLWKYVHFCRCVCTS